MHCSTELFDAIMKLWAEQPEWVKARGRIVVIDGEIKENISSRNCDNADEDGCVVEIPWPIIKANGDAIWITRKFVRYRNIEVTHDYWGRRGPQDEDAERFEVPIELLDEEDDNTKLAQYMQWGGVRENKSDYRGGAMSGLQIQYEYEPRPCIRKEGDRFITCPYHSTTKFIKQVLNADLTPEEKAELLLPRVVRPDRRISSIPEYDWTFDDYWNVQAVLTERCFQLMKRGMSPKKARAKAFAEFINEKPIFSEYRRWWRNKRYEPEVLAKIKEETTLIMRRNAFVELAEAEILRGYAHFVKRGEYGFEANPNHVCPFVLDYPDDKYAAKIVRGYGVSHALWKAKDDNDKMWIRCGDVDELASTWNKRRKDMTDDEWKAEMGCFCETCWQDDVFFDEGQHFRVVIETLFDDDRTEAAINTMAHLEAYGTDAIGAAEHEIWEWVLHNLNYDVGEDPDQHESYDPNDPNETEKDDEVAAKNLKVDEFFDTLKLDIRQRAMSGPVKTYTMSAAQRKKVWDKYIKERVAENKKANEPWVKWLQEFRKLKTPDPVHITLKPEEEREKTREKLDLERAMMGYAKCYWEELEKERERRDDEFRAKWRKKVYANNPEPPKKVYGGGERVHVKTNRRYKSYSPQVIDFWFPSSSRKVEDVV